MNERIRELVRHYEQPKDYTRVPLTNQDVERVHEELGVKLPQQYLDYLNELSNGGIAGVEIMGKGFTGTLIFLDETLDLRNYGLPKNLVIIENCDEWYNCVDCDTGAVVGWDLDGDVWHEFDSFDEFLLDDYEDAIENL